MEKLRQQELNMQARVHAIGWAGLFNGFKGKDDPSIKYTDLLPFPDRSKSEGNGVLSPKTKTIIEDAIKKRELPIQTLTSLAMLLEK
jgi:hypothetical protein